jgi:hypothetical protein
VTAVAQEPWEIHAHARGSPNLLFVLMTCAPRHADPTLSWNLSQGQHSRAHLTSPLCFFSFLLSCRILEPSRNSTYLCTNDLPVLPSACRLWCASLVSWIQDTTEGWGTPQKGRKLDIVSVHTASSRTHAAAHIHTVHHCIVGGRVTSERRPRPRHALAIELFQRLRICTYRVDGTRCRGGHSIQHTLVSNVCVRTPHHCCPLTAAVKCLRHTRVFFTLSCVDVSSAMCYRVTGADHFGTHGSDTSLLFSLGWIQEL